jgi:hypothetical protein
MKAIVVMFVQTRNVNRAAGQPLAAPINQRSQEVAVLDAAKTSGVDKSTIHNEAMPPFWTWFIENPRPDSSRSVRRLAVLTFAA